MNKGNIRLGDLVILPHHVLQAPGTEKETYSLAAFRVLRCWLRRGLQTLITILLSSCFCCRGKSMTFRVTNVAQPLSSQMIQQMVIQKKREGRSPPIKIQCISTIPKTVVPIWTNHVPRWRRPSFSLSQIATKYKTKNWAYLHGLNSLPHKLFHVHRSTYTHLS